MAAMAAICGMDPWLILTCRDQTEFTVMEAIVNRAVDFVEIRDKNLAADIAKKLSGK